MHLEQIRLHLQKLSEQDNLKYSLGKPASGQEILMAEQRLNVIFPGQIKLFYEHYDGLQTEAPELEVFALKSLYFAAPGKLKLATVGSGHHLYFDTSQINEAEQWDIISEDNYCVTKSMASFWSNKIWAWLKRGREIWKADFNSIDCLEKELKFI